MDSSDPQGSVPHDRQVLVRFVWQGEEHVIDTPLMSSARARACDDGNVTHVSEEASAHPFEAGSDLTLLACRSDDPINSVCPTPKLGGALDEDPRV